MNPSIVHLIESQIFKALLMLGNFGIAVIQAVKNPRR